MPRHLIDVADLDELLTIANEDLAEWEGAQPEGDPFGEAEAIAARRALLHRLERDRLQAAGRRWSGPLLHAGTGRLHQLRYDLEHAGTERDETAGRLVVEVVRDVAGDFRYVDVFETDGLALLARDTIQHAIDVLDHHREGLLDASDEAEREALARVSATLAEHLIERGDQ